MLKKILPLFLILIFLSVSGFGCRDPHEKEEITLTFWNLWDDSGQWRELIEAYEIANPNIKIKYYKKNVLEYEEELIDALAAGKGPDIFVINNSWMPRYFDKINPISQELITDSQKLITEREFKEQFVDVAYYDFVVDGKIYAVPFSVDTLALYYNKDFFNTVGIPEPPKTWEEFKDAVERLTEIDEYGNITRAGAAIGTAKNVNRSIDILSLLMLQSGVQMTNPKNTAATFNQGVEIEGKDYLPGLTALRFYVDFANASKRVYTWNPRMHYSIDSFYEGKAAMMFNYSYHIPTIKAKAAKLNFGVAPIPQISGSEVDVNYANYWANAVSSLSFHPTEAWDFILFVAEKENLEKYLAETGKPTARRDLVIKQIDDVYLGVFAEQALTAQSWQQVDEKRIESIFADMIESVVLGQTTAEEALNLAVVQVSRLME
jgi:multiple sugar transport system substrate-binding protein